MMACETGTRAAPKPPCRARNSTSWSSDCAAPHSIETMVKPMTQVASVRRRPKRMAQKPASGVRMAEATI